MATSPSGMQDGFPTSRVVVLVKALPQPSKRYGETVCCAGVTEQREWKRLFPVRFRHLEGRHSFGRWDVITFRYRRPTHDSRSESCHVFEDTIARNGSLPPRERARLLDPLVVPSISSAAAQGRSLALIRPKNTCFRLKPKKPGHIADERAAYKRAAKQTAFFDKQLAEIEPSPFEFIFDFEDGDGHHSFRSGDWETHTMFWKWRMSHGEAGALSRMSAVYNDHYPGRGMAFVVGNQAKRPHVWQLLGVLRLDEVRQPDLFG